MVATHDEPFFIYEDRPPHAEAMAARCDDSTINVVAQVVDMQEENCRQHEQKQMCHELDQAFHELDQAICELDQYHQMVDNAVIITPLVATNGDEEQEQMHHELAQLCQIVENAVIVTPLVAPNSDEEL